MLRVKKILIWLIIVIFFIFPYLWLRESTSFLTRLCGDDIICFLKDNLWEPFRGLFLWPFLNIWTDIGMQKIMTIYALVGIGIVLVYLVATKLDPETARLEKEKQVKEQVEEIKRWVEAIKQQEGEKRK